jgi:Na+-transporting methylmalonyl-CoA/oxaloacetate decarboxylase gamma subunit
MTPAEKVNKKVTKFFDQSWNIFSVILGAVIGFVPAYYTAIDKGDEYVLIIVIGYTIIFAVLVFLITYVFFISSKLHKNFNIIQKEKEDAVYELAKIIESNKILDHSMNVLVKKRLIYEDAVNKYIAVDKLNEEQFKNNTTILATAFHEYLKDICDCAVDAISSRCVEEKPIVESNIKLVTEGGEANGHGYKVTARSRKTRLTRFQADNAIKNYLVKTNAYFLVITASNTGQRYIIENNLSETFAAWSRQFHQAAQEPTAEALKYYSKVICVPIMGKPFMSGRDASKSLIKVEDGGATLALAGLLFIDSPSLLFKEDFDQLIADTLSTDAYSACRAFYRAVEASRKRVYGE